MKNNEMLKYRAINKLQLKIWLENIKKEWLANPEGAENYCRLIEIKYNGDYEYYCVKSRQLFKDCIKRNGKWYFVK